VVMRGKEVVRGFKRQMRWGGIFLVMYVRSQDGGLKSHVRGWCPFLVTCPIDVHRVRAVPWLTPLGQKRLAANRGRRTRSAEMDLSSLFLFAARLVR